MSSTSAVNSSTQPNQSPNSKGYNLKAEDFINMMITQLKNQDPLEPAKNEELLAQMSQIGQLQSATTLQDSLKSMVAQNQIGAAANMMGKSVKGLDGSGKPISGVVSSIKVTDDGVNLELDNGYTLAMSNVTEIGSASTTTTTGSN